MSEPQTHVPEAENETTPEDVVVAEPTTYKAVLYEPLYYGSKEGAVIETDKTLSATALMHAIGYNYAELRKDHVLLGDDTTQPTYERLRTLPFVTSEAEPIDVDVSERTFRTVSYGTERAIVIPAQSNGAGETLYGTSGDKPFPRKKDGSTASWHKVREYIGLSPGSEFQFTVWSTPAFSLPDEIRFRAGIKLSGALTATKQPDVADTVTLNQYIFENVYDVDDSVLTDLVANASRYDTGNDPRTNRFVDVDIDWVNEELIPLVFEHRSDDTE